MESYQDEREIDLKQLFLTVLAKWRVLLVCALAGAVLGGACQIVRGNSAPVQIMGMTDSADSESTEEEVPESYAEYVKEKAYYDGMKAYYEGQIEKDLKLMSERDAYVRDSIRYQMNWTDGVLANADVFVITDASGSGSSQTYTVNGSVLYDLSDPVYHVLGSYNQLVYQEMELSLTAKRYDTEERYIRELISIGRDDYARCITVSAYGFDEEMAEDLVNEVIKTIEGMRDRVTAIAGNHRLEVVRSAPFSVVDGGLYNSRVDIANVLQNIRTRVTTNQDALNKLEEPTEPSDLIIETQENGETSEVTATVAKKGVSVQSVVKYALLGLFVGLFGAAFLYAIYYVLSGRVLSADELNRRYRIKALSVLPGGQKSGLDAKIASLGNDKAYLNMSEEERIQVAASNFSVYAPEVKDVIVVGSVASETLEKVAGLLQDKIKDVHFACASHINENAASLEALKAHESVILVERALSSAYGEVDREIQQLADWGKTVIGSVVIY